MTGYVAVILCVAAVTAWADAKKLSITTIKSEPYIMSKGSELEGFCIDLITQLAQSVGFTYDLHLVKDGRYGMMDASGNWNGMIGEVIRGEADLALAPLTLTAVREQYVDMTTPFMQTGIGFILRKDLTTEESCFSLLSPFSTDLWVGILVAFLLTGFCVFLVGRISPNEWAEPGKEEHNFTLLHSFWYITGALTLQGAGPHPKGLSGRVISAIWWLFAILLLACYIGNLNAKLHSDNNKQLSISTFEDLANQDVIEYGTLEGGSTMMFFKNSKISLYHRIYENMERKKTFVSTMEEGFRRAQEGNFAFIGEEVSLDLAAARYCSLVRSQEVVSMKGYGIAARHGSPLIKNLTVAILQLSELDVLTRLRQKWWASSCGGGSGHGAEALQSYELRGLFLLLGLGLGVGLLLSLFELMSKARTQAKDGKKSCCSVLTAELNQRFGNRGEGSEEADADKSKA